MEHPATLSRNIRHPIYEEAKTNPGVWTESVESVVGVISCRWVPKTLRSGKASFVCYWKLDNKPISDAKLHSLICNYYWPSYQKFIDTSRGNK